MLVSTKKQTEEITANQGLGVVATENKAIPCSAVAATKGTVRPYRSLSLPADEERRIAESQLLENTSPDTVATPKVKEDPNLRPSPMVCCSSRDRLDVTSPLPTK